jgi:hypothetical protein
MWYPLHPQSEKQCLCLQYSSVHCVVHTPTVQSFQSSLDQTPFAPFNHILPNVPMGPVVKFHLIHCCPEACMSAVSIVSTGNIEGVRFFPARSGPGYWDDCCHHPCIRTLFQYRHQITCRRVYCNKPLRLSPPVQWHVIRYLRLLTFLELHVWNAELPLMLRRFLATLFQL